MRFPMDSPNSNKKTIASMDNPSVKTNFAYNVVYQVLALILPLITAPYLSRVLGATQLGIYSYTFSVAYYFVLFAMLGVNNYGNRSIARSRDNRAELSRTFWAIYAFQAILTLLAVAMYVVYALLLAENALIALLWIPYVLSAGLDINWFFFGLEEFKVTVTRNFVVKLLTFCLTLLLVRGEHALVIYCALLSISYLVSVAVLWPFVKRRVDFIRPTLREIASHLLPNLTLFVPVIAVSLYTVLDKVMLGQMSTYEQTGYFENALKVAGMPFTLITALGTVMLPRASHLLACGDRESVGRYLGSSMWAVMMLSFAFAFGLAGVAPVFSPVFFGAGFEACSDLICVIVIEMPFMAWANVLRTQYLIPAGRDRDYVASVIVGAAVNIAVNLLLIPSMGAMGAAWATAAAEAAVCLAQVWSVRGELPQLKWLHECIPFLVIGLAAFVSVRAIGAALATSILTLVIQIGIGIVVYTLLCWIWLAVVTHSKYYESIVVPILKSTWKYVMRR